MEHLYSLLEALNTQKNVDVIKQSSMKEFSIKFRNPIVVENIQLLNIEGEKNKPKFKPKFIINKQRTIIEEKKIIKEIS